MKDLFIALRSSQAQAICKNCLTFAAPEKYPIESLISRDGTHMQRLHRWSFSTGFKLFVFAGVVSIQPWDQLT